MEKQAVKKIKRDEDDGSMDRISELPQPVLHHILCYLSQEEAVQTCVLSKSWRHLGITRPKIEFRWRDFTFPENKDSFMSVFDKILQRYHDQNLSIQEFVLDFFPKDNPQSVANLGNWILMALQKGVKIFDFNFGFVSFASLPSLIFQSQSLEELYLEQCHLNFTDKVLLKHLRTLALKNVFIAEETLDMIFSSCPLIEHVILLWCKGLTTIKVNGVHNLKRFECYCVSETTASIEFNSQTLETIRIDNYRNWYQHHHNDYFPRLKSLFLECVQLPKETIDIFSCNYFPCLEELILVSCHGKEELRLTSPSIKRLTINGSRNSINSVIIDAPNILYLDFSGNSPPYLSFSLTTTSNELRTHMDLTCRVDPDDDVVAFSTWFLKLNELLKALTQSHISLDICCFYYPASQVTFCEPVEVENLIANGHLLSSNFPDSLNLLFRTCRPRYITDMYLYADEEIKYQREHNNQVESLCKIFLNERGETMGEDYFWIHDLKEVSMETFDENAKEWRLVQETSWSGSNLKIRIGLKWKEC